MKRAIPNLSRAASLIVKFNRSESELYDGLAAFYAPSECYSDVGRGEARRWRRVRRQIEGVTGYKYRIVRDEITRRTSAKFAYHFFGGL